jgi:antitoxin component YwqK of YwqJK toxin-antitoxin module
MDKLRENIFTEIGKLLSLSTIKKDLDKARDLVEEDPDLQETMETLKYHYAKLEKSLPEFCKRYPDSPACKNLRK